LKFSDDDMKGPKSPARPVRQSDSDSMPPGNDPLSAPSSPRMGRPYQTAGRDADLNRALGTKDPVLDGHGRLGAGPSDDQDYARFHERVRQGRVKFCSSCGGVMKKSSRRILSAPAGFALLILGSLLMFLYGLATNFYQVPWFATFALPAGYYIGSILVGVGILFFFIRERVWICPTCHEMSKR
jgi:hypothetical protein